MDKKAELPVIVLPTQEAWEQWLDAYHEQSQGVWLKIAKKGSTIATLSYVEAVDGALCYGWIDGQKKSYDDQFWLQKFTPRRRNSVWSKVNTEKVAQLIESGKMKPAGLREVNAAMADGRWDAAYQSHRNLTVPDDFQAQLDRNERAKAFFETLNKQNRFAICYRIQTAKKPETRQARIDKFILMLNNNEKLYP